MNPQTQNKQPDFSFIANQPDPGMQKKPKHKLIFIGFSIFVLIVGLGVLLLFTANKNVKRQPVATNSVEPASSDKTTEQYLGYIKDGKYQDAYGLLAKETKQKFTQDMYTSLVPAIFNNIDVGLCQATGKATGENNVTKATYTCPTKNKEFKATIEFEVVTEDENYRVSNYDIHAGGSDAKT
jgi:hypothetical protein